MAISRYNEAYFASTGSTNPRSFSFDVGSGSDRVLLVFGLYYNGTGTDILSGVTYNGTAMTKVNAVDNVTNAYYTSMWILVNPDSGSNTVSASFSGTPVHSWFIAVSYDGCLQTGQPDTFGGVSSSTATYNVSTTTTVDNDFLIAYSAGNRPVTASTNATLVIEGTGSRSDLGSVFEHSSNPLSPAGAYSITLDQVAGAHNGYHWITIKPAVAGAPANNALAFCPF